jgi:ATP-dependent Clp protease adaptor protein ClpS
MLQTDYASENLTIEQLIDEKSLVVFNDDFNTFDHVIDSLIKICKHEVEQAEQCTWIIHYNGKCQVKKGNFEKLEKMCVALLNQGISAEIQ